MLQGLLCSCRTGRKVPNLRYMASVLLRCLLPAAWMLLPIWSSSYMGMGSIRTSCSFLPLDKVEGREEPQICLGGAGRAW